MYCGFGRWEFEKGTRFVSTTIQYQTLLESFMGVHIKVTVVLATYLEEDNVCLSALLGGN